MPACIRSVNVAQPVDADWAGRLRRTAIDKRPVHRRVAVEPLGLVGDQVADTTFHGGPYQAVYAFAREDLDRWAGDLGHPIPDGHFGENLTTESLDVNAAVVGERWEVGTAVLAVASVRIPCRVFQGWMGATGYDDQRWIRRFTQKARPGPYLRVIEPGEIGPGDPIRVTDVPAHGVTVSEMFRALTTERHLLPRLLDAADDLPPWARDNAERYVATRQPEPEPEPKSEPREVPTTG